MKLIQYTLYYLLLGFANNQIINIIQSQYVYNIIQQSYQQDQMFCCGHTLKFNSKLQNFDNEDPRRIYQFQLTQIFQDFKSQINKRTNLKRLVKLINQPKTIFKKLKNYMLLHQILVNFPELATDLKQNMCFVQPLFDLVNKDFQSWFNIKFIQPYWKFLYNCVNDNSIFLMVHQIQKKDQIYTLTILNDLIGLIQKILEITIQFPKLGRYFIEKTPFLIDFVTIIIIQIKQLYLFLIQVIRSIGKKYQQSNMDEKIYYQTIIMKKIPQINQKTLFAIFNKYFFSLYRQKLRITNSRQFLFDIDKQLELKQMLKKAQKKEKQKNSIITSSAINLNSIQLIIQYQDDYSIRQSKRQNIFQNTVQQSLPKHLGTYLFN